MKLTRFIALGLLLLSCVVMHAERPRSPFGVTASLRLNEGQPVVRVDFTVPAECVLYSERLHFETGDGTELTPVKIATPIVSVDKATGHEKKMYDRNFAADLKLESPFTGNLVVKFQGCSNAMCFFPEKHTFAVNGDGVFAEAATGISTPVEVVPSPDAATTDWHTEAEKFQLVARETGYINAGNFVSFLNKSASGHIEAADDPLARYKRIGLTATLLLIVLGGLGLNLTPCVLPLIPVNLAIIGAGTRARTRREGFMQGGIYGAGMALAYGVLGLVVVLTGSKFGTLNSSIWFNVIIAGIFIALALAMFGFINLDFSRFSSDIGLRQLNTMGHLKKKSRALLTFGFGVVAALLAGACVAPVVVSVLLLSTDLYGKGLAVGLLLPFLLGLGMALPWPFAGASLTFLPKPGKWMTWVKYGFGILILAFAGYYGHTAFDLARTAHASSNLASAPTDGGTPLIGVNQSLTKALQQAREQGRPVFVDFQASWCKNCVAMEEAVFSRTNVRKRLENFIVVKYQAERPNESPAREVLDHFGVMGLPTYVVLSPNK